MLYRRGFRPYPFYDRRRNPRFMPQDIAFQPVEADKKEHSHKDTKQEAAFNESLKEQMHSDRETPPNERLFGSNSKCPYICRLFNLDIFLDDIILLGLIFLLLQEGHDDYIFIFALAFLFLIGKE